MYFSCWLFENHNDSRHLDNISPAKPAEDCRLPAGHLEGLSHGAVGQWCGQTQWFYQVLNNIQIACGPSRNSTILILSSFQSSYGYFQALNVSHKFTIEQWPPSIQ